MFIPVSSLIKTLPRHSRTPEAILALQVRQAATKSLERLGGDLGVEVLGSIKVSTFKNGELTIAAPSLVCCELEMRSGGLKEMINEVLGREIVKGLRLRVS